MATPHQLEGLHRAPPCPLLLVALAEVGEQGEQDADPKLVRPWRLKSSLQLPGSTKQKLPQATRQLEVQDPAPWYRPDRTKFPLHLQPLAGAGPPAPPPLAMQL